MTQYAVVEKKSLEINTQIVIEAISNIRTVASLSKTMQNLLTLTIVPIHEFTPFDRFELGQEKFIAHRYATESMKMAELVRKKTALRGSMSALAAVIPTLANSFTLCYGAFLVMNGEIHFKNIIKWVAFIA